MLKHGDNIWVWVGACACMVVKVLCLSHVERTKFDSYGGSTLNINLVPECWAWGWVGVGPVGDISNADDVLRSLEDAGGGDEDLLLEELPEHVRANLVAEMLARDAIGGDDFSGDEDDEGAPTNLKRKRYEPQDGSDMHIDHDGADDRDDEDADVVVDLDEHSFDMPAMGGDGDGPSISGDDEVRMPADPSHAVNIDQWFRSSSVGAEIMAERSVAMGTVPVGSSLRPYEMSLITRIIGGAEAGALSDHAVVHFVHWSNPSPDHMLGFSVTIRDERAVYPTGQSRQSFVRSEIIHPAIGVVIQRKGITFRQNFRTIIPARILTLKKMWEASQGSWHALLPECWVCNIGLRERVASSGGDSDADSCFCPLCLLCSHTGCCNKLLPSLPTVTLAPAPRDVLPDAFVARLCCLCEAWFAEAGYAQNA